MPRTISHLIEMITRQYKEHRLTLDQAEALFWNISKIHQIPMFAIKSVIQATQFI